MNRSELNVFLNGNHHPGLRSTASTPPPSSPSHIPVPRSCSAKLQERIAGLRNGNNSPNCSPGGVKSMSVAAQRAAFERLDAAAASSSPTASSPSPTGIKVPSGRHSAGNSQFYVASYQDQNNPPSNAPPKSPKTLSRSNSFQEASRWRAKYEDAEKRRKMLLQKSESGELYRDYVTNDDCVITFYRPVVLS